MLKKIMKKSRIYRYFSNLRNLIQNMDNNMSAQIKKQELELEKIKSSIEYLAEKNEKISDSFLFINENLKNMSDYIYECQRIMTLNQKELLHRTMQFDCMNTELLMLNNYNHGIIKVLIVGFYGAPNLGDELMLEAILKKLNMYKNIDITIMIADNLQYDVRKYGNVSFIHYAKNNIDLHRIAKYFDKIIFGGGALLDDSKWGDGEFDNTCMYNVLINLSILAINMKKDVYLLGMSTVPKIENEDYINKLKIIVKNAKYFSVRDANSCNVLKKCGIEEKNIELIDDLVYAIHNCGMINTEKKDKYCIGMILISYANMDILADMVKQCKEYIQQEKNGQGVIKLIPFYENCGCDTSKYEEIKKYVSRDYDSIEIEIAKYMDDYESIVHLFEECNILVSMRYHASLISLKENIPAIHIVYDVHKHYENKMKDLLEKYNATDNSIAISNYNKDCIRDIIRNYKETKKFIADTNFDDLFDFIVMERM